MIFRKYKNRIKDDLRIKELEDSIERLAVKMEGLEDMIESLNDRLTDPSEVERIQRDEAQSRAFADGLVNMMMYGGRKTGGGGGE